MIYPILSPSTGIFAGFNYRLYILTNIVYIWYTIAAGTWFGKAGVRYINT